MPGSRNVSDTPPFPSWAAGTVSEMSNHERQLLATALTVPASDDGVRLVAIYALAKDLGVVRHALTAWLDRNEVPVTLVPSGKVGTFAVERRVDADVVMPLLAGARCKAAACRQYALGPSGLCRDHFSTLTKKQPVETRKCDYCGGRF